MCNSKWGELTIRSWKVKGLSRTTQIKLSQVKSNYFHVFSHENHVSTLSSNVFYTWQIIFLLRIVRTKMSFWLHFTATTVKYGSLMLWWNCINPFHPNIKMHFLLTVFYTIFKVAMRKICLSIKKIYSWWLFPLFSWPSCMIQGLYCWEKLDASHSQGCKG